MDEPYYHQGILDYYLDHEYASAVDMHKAIDRKFRDLLNKITELEKSLCKE